MDLLGTGTIFLIICLSCLMTLSTWRQMRGKSKMPPGPTPLPFIGNFFQVNLKDMHRSLVKISDKYGPVYTIHLGPRRVVVLRGYDAVKEALVDQAEVFSGRGEEAIFDWLFRGYGVAFSDWGRSKLLRRFSITTLRNFGMGKRSIEERILEEAHFLLEALRNTKGAPFDPTFVLSRTVSNVISSIVFGNRFDYEDKEFLSLLNMMLEIFRFNSTSAGQERENPHSEFFLKNLVMTTLNVFFGGTETVSTTLRYGILLMLKFPEIQDKVHREIDQVIGRNRGPNIDDCSQLPYTEAVIYEIQRFGDMLPRGLARRVNSDAQFRGYTIPKGTEVFPLLGSALRDPNYFANPDAFDPQHFLDKNGKFKKNDAFIPFSAGKRYCFGERLARMELSLFFTSLIQNFHIKSPVPPEEIDISPLLVGFATIPRVYDICMIPR